jgi:hypothetical protein
MYAELTVRGETPRDFTKVEFELNAEVRKEAEGNAVGFLVTRSIIL